MEQRVRETQLRTQGWSRSNVRRREVLQNFMGSYQEGEGTDNVENGEKAGDMGGLGWRRRRSLIRKRELGVIEGEI